MDAAPDSQPDAAPFGLLVRHHRLALGLSQEALAERAGISARSLSEIERGGPHRPRRDTVALLADALRLTAADRAALDAAAARLALVADPRPARRPGQPGEDTDVVRMRTNVPLELSSFVGRERELVALAQLLGRTRLLTLTGAGGVGKTRLAVHLTAGLMEGYAQGVWLVELAPLADPTLVPQAVAAAVGVRVDGDRSLLDTLRDALRRRQLLLVLDNCEHLIAACAELAEAILRACPHVRILATSREALGLGGETVWRVPSLERPDRGTLPPLAKLLQFPAVRLFVERAASAQPHFALSAQNAAAIVRICQRLDGIPLALELAAACTAALPVSEVAARLEHSFRLLARGSRTALPRQQTLRGTIDWSYALLSETERVLFARLSVFAGGLTLEAAEAVCAGDDIAADEVLDLLLGLVGKSLVVAEDQDGMMARYRLLEPLRQYAGERLVERGEDAAVQAGHVRHYLALAERAEPELHGPAQVAWFAYLEREHDNLRAALAWCQAVGQQQQSGDSVWAAQTGLCLAGLLWWFWFGHSHQREGLRWLERMLAFDGPALCQARALQGTGVFAWDMGHTIRGQALLEESVALYRQEGEWTGLSTSLAWLGLALRHWRDADALPVTDGYELGSARLDEGLRLARELGDPLLIGHALSCLATSANLGEEAERDHGWQAAEEALPLLRRVDNLMWIGHVQRARGQIALHRRDYEVARIAFAEDLALKRLLGDPIGTALALGNLGHVVYAQGDYAGATAYHEQSVSLLRAVSYYEEQLAGVFRHLGYALLAQGEYTAARGYLVESLTTARDHGSGRGSFVEGYGTAMRRMTGQEQIVAALEALASLDAAAGEPQRAVRLAGAAVAWRERAGLPLTAEEQATLRRLLAPARQALGAEAQAAAWAGGRAMPLEQAVAEALAERAP
jgi:non-specific serine/threonine protein kinase